MADFNKYNGSAGGGFGAPEVPIHFGQGTDAIGDIVANNQNKLANISLKTDGQGNGKLFGITVDRSLLPVVQSGLNVVKVQLLERSKDLYKSLLVAAQAVGLKGQNAKTAAIAVDSALRWGIIGAEQISAAATANTDFIKKRKELYVKFKPIVQATGINAKNNEVLALAYQRAGKEYHEDLKWLLTDLPTVVPLAMLASKEQKGAAERYKHEYDEVMRSGGANAKAAASLSGTRESAAKQAMDAGTQSFKLIRESKNQWVEEQLAELKIPKNQQAKAKLELEAHFDEHIAPRMRNEFHPDSNSGTVNLSNEDKEKADKNFNFLAYAGIVGTSILKSVAGKKHSKELQMTHVPEMVEDLQNAISSQLDGVNKDRYGRMEMGGKSADDIVVTGRDGNSLSLKEYILEMFQQHERDREPGTDWAKRDKDGNPVQIIDPLGSALVAKLEPSISIIADAIASGLDPAAMINLIGGNEIIVHGAKGAKTFATEDKVRDVVDTLMPMMGAHEEIKMEEYLAKFEKPEDIKNLIKTNLDSMKGKERQLFAGLLPDDILKQFGMKHGDIVKLRKESHKDMYDFVAANVVYLAGKDDENLKKLGLAEEEIANVKSLAEKIAAGDEAALKTAVDGHDKSIVDAVRTAGLLEQHHGGEGKDYWAHRAAEMQTVHAQLQDVAAQGERDPLQKLGYDGEFDERPSHAERVGRRGNYDRDEREGFADGLESTRRPRAENLKRDPMFTGRENTRDLPDGEYAYER